MCYRVDGPTNGPAMLLIGGLGEDLSCWSDVFVDALVTHGYRIVRPDNRDSGRSSRIDRRPPGPLRQLFAHPRSDAYTLREMASDHVGLLDYLDIESAHVVGRSMGGMIAQSLAANLSDRVTTLTSIYSTTGAQDVGQPTVKTKLMLIGSPPPKNRDRAIESHLTMLRHLSGRTYPMHEVTETQLAGTVWDRANGANADGVARQIQAIHASGDRTAELGRITVPTLVLNGDRDLIVDPSGGLATAKSIAHARHVIVPGMGHHLHDLLAQYVADAIHTLVTTEAAVSASDD